MTHTFFTCQGPLFCLFLQEAGGPRRLLRSPLLCTVVGSSSTQDLMFYMSEAGSPAPEGGAVVGVGVWGGLCLVQ